MNWYQILFDAGLPVISAEVNKFGKVTAQFSRELTAQEWIQFLQLTDPPAARKYKAKSAAALATVFRTLTPEQAENYIDANVTTLASAKAVLRIFARIIVAMRDEIWPDL